MQKENFKLKRSFIIQSFAPLFLLLTIKHIDLKLYVELIGKFFCELSKKGVNVFTLVLNHDSFGSFVVSIIGIVWLTVTIAIALGFNGMQKSGFQSLGENIKIEETNNDSSATFLVTYVLPLLTDDVTTFRGLVVFLVMLAMVIKLLSSSNTFYQNPVLAAMKYKTFSFRFLNPRHDSTNRDKLYIGITRGNPIDEKSVIKRKYISDGVYVIYND